MIVDLRFMKEMTILETVSNIEKLSQRSQRAVQLLKIVNECLENSSSQEKPGEILNDLYWKLSTEVDNCSISKRVLIDSGYLLPIQCEVMKKLCKVQNFVPVDG